MGGGGLAEREGAVDDHAQVPGRDVGQVAIDDLVGAVTEEQFRSQEVADEMAAMPTPLAPAWISAVSPGWSRPNSNSASLAVPLSSPPRAAR
jgi:hypothetical protein